MGIREAIAPHMEVLTSDGVMVGKVERLEATSMRLTQTDPHEPGHQSIPLTLVARVDRRVHLNVARAGLTAAAKAGVPGAVTTSAAGLGLGLGAGGMGAAAAASPAKPADGSAHDPLEGPLPPVRNPAVEGARPRGNYYLPWVLGALLLLALLFALLRGCDTDDERAQAGREQAPGQAVATRNEDGAARGNYVAGTIAYDLDRFLAGGEPAPRTFTFDRLNFATRSSAVSQSDIADLDQLAQVLTAYPTARIAIIGYTDARGSGRANAELGAERANSVASALAARGIARERLEARSGGEQAPLADNRRAEGRAENRRTELIVLSR